MLPIKEKQKAKVVNGFENHSFKFGEVITFMYAIYKDETREYWYIFRNDSNNIQRLKEYEFKLID